MDDIENEKYFFFCFRGKNDFIFVVVRYPFDLRFWMIYEIRCIVLIIMVRLIMLSNAFQYSKTHYKHAESATVTMRADFERL